jgi:STE24 endopeptidase
MNIGPSNWLTALILAAIAAEAAIRWWLAGRQIAAVGAHRDQVPKLFSGQIDMAAQVKAADYTIARVRLGRWAVGAEALMKLAFTVGGGIAAVNAAFRLSSLQEPWRGTLLVLSVLLLLQLLGQPFAIWRIFRIETRFGFNRMTPRLYLLDFCKRQLLGLALGGPVLLIILLLMEQGGPGWWIWASMVVSAVTVGIAWASPRFIAPLFNRFSPLADAALGQRLKGLFARCGFSARGVFVMDGSRRSAHGNAYFTGIGRNKVVVLFDTLLQKIDGDEIEAVLAHELGHFRLHHVLERLWASAIGNFLGFAVLNWLMRQPGAFEALGVAEPSAPIALLLFTLMAPVMIFFTTPLRSWWWRRQEWAADDYASKHADAGKLASALVKLYRDNASTLTPDRIYSRFYDSHPTAIERIERLNALATR